MTERDENDLRDLAFQLGMVCGAMSRPAIREGLVDLLRAPGGAFSLAAVRRMHNQLAEVLARVEELTP